MHPDALVPIGIATPSARTLVGAKACSLQQLSIWGFPGPPACVLTTLFFEPWCDAIRRQPSWLLLTQAAPEQWPRLSAELRAAALALPFCDAQHAILDLLTHQLAALGPARRFAVRSSAPDEDGANASFAGLYATELGVALEAVPDAIRRCFAACLDERVFAYKAAQGMGVDGLSMALIVQEHVDSVAAGVGFSINPLINDFDELVIDANWGLGESVVSGMTSPDQFIIDKASAEVRRRTAGAKHLAVRLAAGNGTTVANQAPSAAFCLDAQQLAELATAIGQIEARYGYPVDIEWAFSTSRLFILQARPITAYVPLPLAMLSRPGARRTLYMDIALSKGMTTNEPISPMGLDWLAGDIGLMLRQVTGAHKLATDSPHGLLYLGGGRMYINLSNLLCFCSPARLAQANSATDQLMADTLRQIDRARYRAVTSPSWIWPALRALPVMLWRLRRPLWHTVSAMLAPERAHRTYQRRTLDFERQYQAPFDPALPLARFRERYGAPAIAHIIEVDMPAMAAGVMAMSFITWLAARGDAVNQALAEQASRGIGGNLVVEMGIEMFRMAQMLEPGAFADPPALHARIVARQMAPGFLIAWDRFMHTYGCRGPGEMDLATARYADDPLLLLRQMSFMADSNAQFDPEAAHRRLAHQRQQAGVGLAERFGWVRTMLLKRATRVVDLFGGTRDTPKQHNLMYQHVVRRGLLAEGGKLAAAGRLDRPEQIFDLMLADLDLAAADSALDLRALSLQRGAFGTQLRRHVRSFPSVIDSRGRIGRPHRPVECDGAIAGMAVAPGVARGKVKVLRTAHDKIVERGDILVAFTTDPGWTPLFINAAAIVLEVGGVLQHGAVVAREYGKPCVAGIAGVLDRFTDGHLVEVDGNTGVVRLIDAADSPAGAPRHPCTAQAA